MASVNNLTGSIVALVTPFKENGDIDFDALDRARLRAWEALF